jgi:hypothetical protein
MTSDKHIFSVISGDVVKSSAIPVQELSKLRSVTFQISSEIADIFDRPYTLGFSLYKGDSFQALIDRPEISPSIALVFRTLLRNAFLPFKLDARIAIGIGQVESIPQNADQLGYGPAYTRAGRLLENQKSKTDLLISSDNPKLDERINGYLVLVNERVKHWTPGQIKTISTAFHHLNTDKLIRRIAKERKVAESTISIHLKKASYLPILNAMEIISKIIQEEWSLKNSSI